MYTFSDVEAFKTHENATNEYFRNDYHNELFGDIKKNQQELCKFEHDLNTKDKEGTESTSVTIQS